MDNQDTCHKEQTETAEPSHISSKGLGTITHMMLLRSLCYFSEIIAIVLLCVMFCSRPISTKPYNSSKPGPIIRTTNLINDNPIAVSLPHSNIEVNNNPTGYFYLTNSEYFGVCIVWVIASLTFI